MQSEFNKKILEEKDWIKWNFLQLADEHRKHCKGEYCTISLMSLHSALLLLKVKLTKNERKRFL